MSFFHVEWSGCIELIFFFVSGVTGDYQFDVYRMMREHNGGQWEEFKPFSNVMVCSPSDSWAA